MIYVVASQQDLHLAQLFKIEELMGRKDISEKCQHINFGMVMGKYRYFVVSHTVLIFSRNEHSKRHSQVS